ncbi:MAG TPA: DUF4124 domain-containing protein [Burkholderiaceae bacterium]|nr:DUF4124 domain-containing protein [Burkholderiaceae bacterium]
MTRLASVLGFVSCALSIGASAQASDIFVCVGENGEKQFTNTGSVKTCKKMDVQPILTLPAARVTQSRTGAQPAVEQRASVSPASFPRVDGDTQRTRDSDRRRILEDELRGEEERLAKLKSEFNNGEPERRGDERNFALYKERTQRLQEDIARTENNVRALAREMSLLKTQ